MTNTADKKEDKTEKKNQSRGEKKHKKEPSYIRQKNRELQVYMELTWAKENFKKYNLLI